MLITLSSITNSTYADESFKILETVSTNSWSIGLSINENEFYVADGINNKILIFDLQGKSIREFHLQENNCKGHIHGINVHKNHIYVIKENNDCIGVYDLNGNIINEFGSKGEKDGEFNSPQNVEVFKNSIFVTDTFNKRIQVFDLEGKFLESIDVNKEVLKYKIGTPYDLEIYQDKIYITLPKENQIQVFDLEGKFLESIDVTNHFTDPLGITIRNEILFVASGDLNKIFILEMNGELIDEIDSDFNDPHQVILQKNKMYVLDTRNFLVKIFLIPEIMNSDEFENKSMNDLKYQEYFLIFIPLIFLGMFLIKKLLIKQRK